MDSDRFNPQIRLDFSFNKIRHSHPDLRPQFANAHLIYSHLLGLYRLRSKSRSSLNRCREQRSVRRYAQLIKRVNLIGKLFLSSFYFQERVNSDNEYEDHWFEEDEMLRPFPCSRSYLQRRISKESPNSRDG